MRTLGLFETAIQNKEKTKVLNSEHVWQARKTNCNFSLEILLAWSSNLIVTYMLDAELISAPDLHVLWY